MNLVGAAEQLDELVKRVGRQHEGVPDAQQQPQHAPQLVLLLACAGVPTTTAFNNIQIVFEEVSRGPGTISDSLLCHRPPSPTLPSLLHMHRRLMLCGFEVH